MRSSWLIALRAAVCLAGVTLVCARAPAQRVANTTLAVPQQPPADEFQLVPAFAGLGFEEPVAIVAAPGDTNRLFVVEKYGAIRVITNLAAPDKSLFLDLTDRVDPGGEGGLLGLAFHPGWASNRQFFVFYTSPTGNGPGGGFFDCLARFEIDPQDANVALPGSEQRLFSQPDEWSNHNAGDLHFGPDGYLYVATGDEGAAGDLADNSRHLDKDFFSAILRLDVDKLPGSVPPNPHPAIHTNELGAAFYAVPPDNPFLGATNFNGAPVDPAGVRTEFWAVGLRNPWRITFDPLDGRLFCADVGQSSREEINLITRGGDYGWRYREGFLEQEAGAPAGVTFVNPILDYPHAEAEAQAIPGGRAYGDCVIGGVVCRAPSLPQLAGSYLFGDYGNGRLFALRHDAATGSVTEFRQLTSTDMPVAFGLDPANGDVLLACLTGELLRLVAVTNAGAGGPLPPWLSQTGAFNDLATLAPHAGILPYEVNAPFWSDHALKSRWFCVPDPAATMTFDPAGHWSFPTGQVWIKHFELELTNGVPESRRRLETRFLVRNAGGVHGFTYRWNDAQTDAELVAGEGTNETFTVRDPEGVVLREQLWRYPSRTECLRCHNAAAGHALGFNTAQLDRAAAGPLSPNQLDALAGLGYFDAPPAAAHAQPALAPPGATGVSLEWRARSYLQANCSPCHRPGGAATGLWDARAGTLTDDAGLLDGPLYNNQGDPDRRVIAPGDPARSELLRRLSLRGPGQMPPLASTVADPEGMALLAQWITDALPARRNFAQWQMEVFGSTEAPEAAPDFDFDGDGRDNFAEWLARTDATEPADAWRIDVTRMGDTVAVTYQQPAGRAVEVQYRTALDAAKQWRALETPENRPSFPATNRAVILPDTTATGTNRFYRARLLPGP